jgi:hypothetical protein
MESQVLT